MNNVSMEKQVYRRIYRVRCGSAFCMSTRLRDINRFVSNILCTEGDRVIGMIEFEVVSQYR